MITYFKVTNFLGETNSSELTALSVVIVSLTGVACIEAAGIGSTCTRDTYVSSIKTPKK